MLEKEGVRVLEGKRCKYTVDGCGIASMCSSSSVNHRTSVNKMLPKINNWWFQLFLKTSLKNLLRALKKSKDSSFRPIELTSTMVRRLKRKKQFCKENKMPSNDGLDGLR